MSVLSKSILEKKISAALIESEENEIRGDYNAAFLPLEFIWSAIDQRPAIEKLPSQLRPRVLLQCGIVAGFLGNRNEIGQENAKDLLCEAINLFLKQQPKNYELLARAENHIGLCYLRSGQYQNARVWFIKSLQRPIEELSETRLQTHTFLALNKLKQKNYKALLTYSLTYIDTILNYASANTIGCFLQNLSCAYRFYKDYENSLSYLMMAKPYFEVINNIRYLALTDNNIALNYKDLEFYDKAHKFIDCCIEGFETLNDPVYTGDAYDSKGSICLGEKDFTRALFHADYAAAILKNTQEYATYAGALITKLKAEFALGRVFEALQTYTIIIDIARQHLDEDFLNTTIATFAALIKPTQTNEKLSELEIPINGEGFVAISEDEIAVTTNDRIEQGGLVVLCYRGANYIGRFTQDKQLDLIVLQLQDSNPMIIAAEDATNIRKIIGFCYKKDGYKFKRLNS